MLLNTSIHKIVGIDMIIANAMLWNINYSKMDKIYASGRCPEPVEEVKKRKKTNALFIHSPSIVRGRKKEASIVKASFPPSVEL
jgi:hypothetical protein